MKFRTGPSAATLAEIDTFIEECEALLCHVDDLPSRAEDFKASCSETLDGMIATAREQQRVTERMRDARDNIESGVSRWER